MVSRTASEAVTEAVIEAVIVSIVAVAALKCSHEDATTIGEAAVVACLMVHHLLSEVRKDPSVVPSASLVVELSRL